MKKANASRCNYGLGVMLLQVVPPSVVAMIVVLGMGPLLCESAQPLFASMKIN